jgi:hypothetical protein
MKSHSVFGCGALIATVLMGTEAAADPFELIAQTYQVGTGVLVGVGTNLFKNGKLDVTLPVPDYLAVKGFSSGQFVTPGGPDKSEAYLQLSPTNKDIGFASAQGSGNTLEVGVDLRTSVTQVGTAVSRLMMTIKNNFDDRSLTALEFDFTIPEGRVEYTDFSQKFFGVHSRVQAMIDYSLLSPSGPFGGTYDETTGQLFNYWVDLDDEKYLTQTSTASVTGFTSPSGSRIVYFIDPYSGTLRLPIIPPRGELTIYYDMYAIVSGHPETLAAAFLGDPTDLTGQGSFALRLLEDLGDPGTPGTVPAPEPASMLLLGAGLLATAAKLRTRR